MGISGTGPVQRGWNRSKCGAVLLDHLGGGSAGVQWVYAALWKVYLGPWLDLCHPQVIQVQSHSLGAKRWAQGGGSAGSREFPRVPSCMELTKEKGELFQNGGVSESSPRRQPRASSHGLLKNCHSHEPPGPDPGTNLHLCSARCSPQAG